MQETKIEIPYVQVGRLRDHRAFRFSHHAMGTVFEIYIINEDPRYAHQAAEEAFLLISRLEQDLSHFIENSDISRINSLARGESTPLNLDTFECLRKSRLLWEQTQGAFDVTIGPLFHAWLTEDRQLRNPTKEEIERARARTGMSLLQLDEEGFRATVLADSMFIDLGGIGKGFAIDRVVELFKEWEIDTAFLHGGRSTGYALGAPAGESGWPVTISHPETQKVLGRFTIKDAALSGSGLEKGRHIIDSASGDPVSGRLAAWAIAPDATTSDALSTAFMIMTAEEIRDYCEAFPETSALVFAADGDENEPLVCTGLFEKILRLGRR